MNKILNRSVSLALLLLFSYSLLALIISSFGCSVRPAFYLWVALLCFSTWYTTCTRSGVWIGLPVSALLLFAASRFFASDLSQQLNDVFDRLTGAYVEQLLNPGESYAYLNGVSDHSLLFLFLVFLLSSYMGAAITSRSGRVGLALLGSVPFFVTCLAVSSSLPVLPTCGMILFWFLLAVGGSHYHEDSTCCRRVIGSLLPLALLLSLLLLYVDPADYTYDPAQSPVSQVLDRLFHELDARINELLNGERLNDPDAVPLDSDDENSPSPLSNQTHLPWQNSSGDLDLTRKPDPAELDAVFLRVRADRDGNLYLRGVSYGDYSGTSWTRTAEEAPVSSLAFTANAVKDSGSDSQSLSVQFVRQSAYRYLPYFSEEEQGYDSFVPSGFLGRYSTRCLSFPASFTGLRVPEALSDAEAQYRAYAHTYYTQLPETSRAALQSICVNNGLYPEMEDPVTQVAAFVQKTGTYDASVEGFSGSDCAVSFLTDNKRGCCIHFATAAAALYRYLGIPARITEGFLVEAKAGTAVDIKGYQAHAWVEVYQDGLGWLPVEVTGQSGLDSDALGAHDSDPPPSSSEPDPIPPDLSPESAPPLPVGLLSEPESSAVQEQTSSPVLRFFLWALTIVLLIAFLPLRRRLLLLLRSRSYEQPDARKAVIALYQTARRAEEYGAEIPPLLTVTAERAAFSQHAISREEAEACRDQLFILLKSCYLKLNRWDKFRYRYLSALL